MHHTETRKPKREGRKVAIMAVFTGRKQGRSHRKIRLTEGNAKNVVI
jgi:hypothetical protein